MTELSERLERASSVYKSGGRKVGTPKDAFESVLLTNDDVDEIVRTKDWEAIGVFLKLLIVHEHRAKFRGLK